MNPEPDLPVSIPRLAEIPSNKMKRTRGSNPYGGGEFRLSVAASMTMRRMAVIKNSEKNADTFVSKPAL